MRDSTYPQVRIQPNTKPKIQAVAKRHRMSFGQAIDAAFDLWQIAPEKLRVQAIRGTEQPKQPATTAA